MPLSALLWRLEAFAEPGQPAEADYRRWSDEEEALLRRLWPEREVPVKEIAARLNRTWSAVVWRAHLLGMKARHAHYFDQTDPKAIRRLYLGEGLSRGAIADRYGVCEATVRAFMARHGIQVRATTAQRPGSAHPWRRVPAKRAAA